ncbi:MAG: hypothetical protein GEV07_16335 [Streptosporangiales bacterium]|nr:hypothetical protein [Streptosporangiales bacterium]
MHDSSPIFNRRALLRGSAALGVMGALSGCVNPTDPSVVSDELTERAAGKPNRGGVLRYGLSTDTSDLEPHVSTGSASNTVKQLIYNSLLKYDDNGDIVGDLATDFGFSDPKTYEVTIHRGVKFHDGSTLTVDDVVFTIERIMDEKTAATDASQYADVTRVEAIGADKVVFHLRQPNVVLPHALASASSPIVSKAWIEKGVDPRTQTMGTGPFRLVERVPGVSITLKRFDEYFEDGLPYLNGIQFLPMEDDYARVSALRSAVVDFIDYVPPTHLDVLTKARGVRIASDSTFGFGYVGFVLGRKPLRDIRVRQAFAYGIDRKAVLQTAFLDHGEPMTGGLLAKGMLGYDPDLADRYPYDPDRAKSLLRKAGFGKLDIDMVTTSSYSVIDRPAQGMLPSLRGSGEDTKLVRQEWLTFRKTVEAKTFPTHAWGTAIEHSDPDALSVVLGSDSPNAQYLEFKDERIDSLLAQGRRETDEGKRADIYREVENRTLDLLPWTYTVRRVQAEAMRDYVKGYAHPRKGAWTQTALRKVWLERRE